MRRIPVTVYYVADYGVLGQTGVHAKLRALRDLIDTQTRFDTFQAIEEADIDSSDTNPANVAFQVETMTNIVAGLVSWQPGLLIDG
jgi:hypothetical protein